MGFTSDGGLPVPSAARRMVEVDRGESIIGIDPGMTESSGEPGVTSLRIGAAAGLPALLES
jgi:hypothetical protein